MAYACLDAVAVGFCKAHTTRLPTPADHRNALKRKADWPRGSAEGQPRAHMAVPIGCQVSADWHVRLRICARGAR